MTTAGPAGHDATRGWWGRRFAAHPVAWLWTVALLIELTLIPVFLLTGAGEALERGLAESGLGFNTDLVTAARLVVAAPYTLGAVLLSIGQVAAPDLALLLVAGLGFGAAGLRAVKRRWRWWSPAVGWRRGVRTWVSVVVVFSAMNLASAGLHWLTLRDAGFVYTPPSLSLSFVAAFLIAMFLDAGAVFEESAWRGFALPLLQSRHTPLVASVILGVLWSAWHLPVKFDLALEFGPAGFLGMFAVLTVKFVLLSVIMTHFVNRVGISIPLAIAMHGLSNDSVRLGGLVETDAFWGQLLTEVNLIVPMAVVAAVLVVRTRGRLGLQPLPPPVSPAGRPASPRGGPVRSTAPPA